MLSRSHLEWLVFTLCGVVACDLVSSGDTPIDRALPFVAVAIGIWGWMARETRWVHVVFAALPLLVGAAMFFVDPRARLLAYGVIVAAELAVAANAAATTLTANVILTVTGVFILRWIPFPGMAVWREMIVVIGALAVLVALREHGPLSMAIALAVALVTPIFPGRALLVPFLVAIVAGVRWPARLRAALVVGLLAAAWFSRYSLAVLFMVAAIAVAGPPIRRMRLVAPVYVGAIALFALWPWSGLVARAFPRFLFARAASERRQVIGLALDASQSVFLDVPEHVHAMTLTASGANASHMRTGRVVGRIEVTTRGGGHVRRDLRIGDIADFGFMRREQFFYSRNPSPRHPTDDIRGFGASTWLHGAGRVTVGGGGELITARVIAAGDLPPDTRLQLETVEFE